MAATVLTARDLHLLHRWMGIGLGLVVLIWFVSGVVMLFVSRPALEESERLQALPELGPTAAFAAPLAAWQSLGLTGWPEDVRLNAANGQPAYHFLAEGKWSSVRAADGMPLSATSASQSVDTARKLVPDGNVVAVTAIDTDQWTVYRSFDAWRPFLRVEFDNGDQIYISSRTGEAVLDTNKWERVGNWLGSVVHWVYFVPIRQHAQLWRSTVLVLSFLALLLAASGLWLGFQRLRLVRRYKEGRISPYRERLKKWHHLLGIAGGGFIVSWLLSGWLSMSPLGLAAGIGPSQQDHLGFAGGPLSADVLGLEANWPQGTREIEWLRIGGEGVMRQRGAEEENRLTWQDGRHMSSLSLEMIARSAAQLRAGTAYSAEWLHAPDRRYYPLRHHQKPFPVARISFEDERNSVFYIDPEAASITMLSDRTDAAHRWLFLALHRLDFPLLVASPLVRDILVIAFSMLGGAVVMAGCILGWRRLGK